MFKTNLNDLEILKIAMSMEEEGINFYLNVAKYSQGDIKRFLEHAAGQELAHKEKIGSLYDEFSKKSDFEDNYIFEPEVQAYLRAFIENKVFNKGEYEKELFKDIKSAAEYAIKSENLSVELYSKMYEGINYVKAKEVMKILIEEEKSHVEYFTKLLSEL
jgi:rubrerythrin